MNPTTGLPSAAKLCAAYWAMTEVERIDRAIAEYERNGIAGTVHDLEHKRLRLDAIERVREALA